MKLKIKTTIVTLTINFLMIIPCVSAQSAQTRFKIKITNLSPYEISPGGYVVHNTDYTLFKLGMPASAAVRSLCEIGRTPDFLFYVRRDEDSIGRAFSFDGGLKPKGSAEGESTEAIFPADPEDPLLSFIHKVSFSDDSCIGQAAVRLFDETGQPVSSSFEVGAFDAGTRENIRLTPPQGGILAQLNWKMTDNASTIPAQALVKSPIFGDSPLMKVSIVPMPD